MDKQALREWAKDIRKTLDIDNLSQILAQKLSSSEVYKKAKNILIFYPLKYEVNLLSLMQDSSKDFYLPKIDGNNLLCCPYNEGDETCLSCFKTCEPVSSPCDKSLIDLAVVPALACDENGYRLGYGAGFYDRFLEKFDGIKVCCVPSLLLVQTVYPEIYDVKMDYVITEKDD